MMKKVFALTLLIIVLGACAAANPLDQPPPTATLAPIVSLTPRFTATPVPSRTPSPTLTLTPTETTIPPSPTNTFTPSPTPPVIGVIASLQSVNVREGPGVNFAILEALQPGTGVEILTQDGEGRWYNIRMPDGVEGWISADLVRLQPSATPLPSLTPSPDFTAIALGTTFPTAVIGGNPVSPTPPPQVVTPTLPVESIETTPEPGLRTPDLEPINQTATALAGGALLSTADASTAEPGSSAPTQAVTPGQVGVVQGQDVLAICDDPSNRQPPPTNLAAGSTIDIFWFWYARTEQQVRDHIAAANYEVRLDGNLIGNWRNFTSSIQQRDDGLYYVFWYVRSQPLDAGEHRITYQVTWNNPINDGFEDFGPGTANPLHTGTCTFTVR
jgi:uncharacterized protein YgiM (DUF1202 family)